MPSNEPRSPGLFEIAWQVQKKGALQFFMDQWHAQGDLTHLRMGAAKLLFAVHPDHVRHVYTTGRQGFDKGQTWEGSRRLLLGDGLIASTGLLWKRQRRLMASFFTPKSVEAYYPVVVAASEALAQRWDEYAASGKTVDMIDEMMRVAASIILKAMFGVDIGQAQLRALEGDVEQMVWFTNHREMWPVKPPLWTPLPAYRRYHAARARVHALIRNVIASRRRQPQELWPNDLLARLMSVRDPETGEAMSDTLVHDEVLGIFVAGHETTARTLAFLCWALYENPDVAKQLHAELDAVLAQDELPSLEHLKRLPYLLRTVKEVLRLYPPSPAQPRDPLVIQDLGGTRVEPGSYVMLFPYATHRHPDFWKDPERFDPDRFLPDQENGRHPFAYFPFGGGQRICIGNNFAMLEASLLAAHLVRRFRFELLAGARPELEIRGTLTVRKGGLPMRIMRR